MTTLRAACVQLNSGPDIDPNLERAGALVREAVAQGAAFVALPENTSAIIVGRRETLERTPTPEEHPGIPYFSDLARSLSVPVLVGSMAVRLSESLCANRSFLFDAAGRVQATYDKIHMFDVDLEGGESYRESATFQAGDKAIVTQMPGAMLGLSICYDLRFPGLYRRLAKGGAELLSIPAAFTVPTGRAHWHVLLRARAIETGCFVLAPAQTGTHHKGRKTYGHSLIVDPWGEVLADAGEGEGVVLADLDLRKVKRAREAVPSLYHDRPFVPPSLVARAAE